MLKRVTDMKELPQEAMVDASADGQRHAEFARAAVEAATSRKPTRKPWPSAVRCMELFGDAECRERVQVRRVGGEIEWFCPGCAAFGVVSGFEASAHDLSPYIPREKLRQWGMSGEQREILWEATRSLPQMRAVIARAISPSETDDALLVSASVRELDALYELIEELIEGARDGRRRELLERLRFSLSTSIDGF